MWIREVVRVEYKSCQKIRVMHWRASLVPAAAVIPAPGVYIQVVAVEKLVVHIQIPVCEIT